MNTSDTNTRPFGFWITAVDRLMRAEFATVFADEGITRRDWRLLNVIDGTVPGAADSHRGHRARGFKARRLVELGWITRSEDGWTLTEAGTLAKERLSLAVDEIRARITNVLDPEEYTAMTASLEKIAREFGWEEGKRLPRSQRHGRGHGHGQDHGHGYGFDPHARHRHGFRHGFGHRSAPRGFDRAITPATHIHIHTNS